MCESELNLCKKAINPLSSEEIIQSIIKEEPSTNFINTLEIVMSLAVENDQFFALKGYQRANLLDSVNKLRRLLQSIGCYDCQSKIQSSPEDHKDK